LHTHSEEGQKKEKGKATSTIHKVYPKGGTRQEKEREKKEQPAQ